jgi:hypothetical protein
LEMVAIENRGACGKSVPFSPSNTVLQAPSPRVLEGSPGK